MLYGACGFEKSERHDGHDVSVLFLFVVSWLFQILQLGARADDYTKTFSLVSKSH